MDRLDELAKPLFKESPILLLAFVLGVSQLQDLAGREPDLFLQRKGGDHAEDL